MLPSFLSPLSTAPRHANATALNAVFFHKAPLGQAHCLWWPQKKPSGSPRMVVLFIPGNPGLVEFYTPFLSELHHSDSTSKLAILAHGHLNHTPLPDTKANAADHSLVAQVQSAVEAFDALKSEFGDNAQFFLVGHSVGSWMALQVLKARKETVSGVFFLFPTISNIGATPNGRKLSRVFTPLPRRIISSLGYAARFVPVTVLSCLFPEWPSSQLLVLQDLVRSPLAIDAALAMANDEMRTIKELDLPLLQDCKDRLYFYYTERDDWVGEERDRTLKALQLDEESLSVVRDTHGIPHAFCINHGEHLAQQCLVWLKHFATS